MSRLLFLILCSILLFFAFSQERSNPAVPIDAYARAEKLFLIAQEYGNRNDYDEAEELRLYREALNAFERILPALSKHDSLLFHAHSRIGLIAYYLDSTDQARHSFRTAMQVAETGADVSDSFLFKPLLYSGGIHYDLNSFDSAFYYYKRAEAIQDRYARPLEESQRVYNRLGVMYYETGNYRLARNYFEKAIGVLETTAAGDPGLLVNYRMNIAALLVKLEEFDEAQRLYEQILPFNHFLNEIHHNLGIIQLRRENFHEAIRHLRRVNYGENRRNIDLYYNFAMAWYGLERSDSGDAFLQKAAQENQHWNGNRRNIPYGLILKLRAERLRAEGKWPQALQYYQRALQQFQFNFNDSNIYSNPAEFSGIFSYLNVFSTLAGKAETFELWHEQSKQLRYLAAALDAYRSAFSLAAYVERTYESDEARLFFNRMKHSVHNRPIEVAIRMYEQTGENRYLEDAYLFDQQNKASTLALALREMELQRNFAASFPLFEEEAGLKRELARLLLRAAQAEQPSELDSIHSRMRDHEIRLAQIGEQLHTIPAYRERHSAQFIPSINEVHGLLDRGTALVSFHFSEKQILALILTDGEMSYSKSAVDSIFYGRIDTLKHSLQRQERSENATQAARELHRVLFSPVLEKAGPVKRLIIIPDDELHYLPCEVLIGPDNKYLVEGYAIQYQYSTALLHHRGPIHKSADVISFAPFASRGYTDTSGVALTRLPASLEEVRELKGRMFTDAEASKQNFMRFAGDYSTIHLATHATANNEFPEQSYIAFNPAAGDHRLHAAEIFAMDLDSTSLVILSACETGAGKLIRGEGLASLSRAFAYAGCPNIITSLWKAEDRTTAYLVRRLHEYLRKGYSSDRALRQAKVDLLGDPEIDPRYKAPGYWAHLVFIGEYEPQRSGTRWIWLLGAALTAAITLFILNKGRKRGRPAV
ncbi:MAG TPA: CHAT domain-containing protein [Chitinophagaceae bacterium]|nr:CHAT domain-containing protein [Chitinophagaceae bacterium]